jgi:hypothetical protein|tara:strand:+ start:37 stop:228 length:192 start_codon:yes stop_codon:yes gene_type:complete
MVKKVRLLDETEVQTTDESVVSAAPLTDGTIDAEKLMKYLEAIDWKLWEMLKLARKHDEAGEK